MKAVVSNRIFLEVTGAEAQRLRESLTYRIATYGDGPPMIMQNFYMFRSNIISIPAGRGDLIPSDAVVVDKRILAPIEFPEFNGKLRESQKAILDAVEDNCIINAKPGWGKAQPGSAKIKTSSGWTTMKDILVGDKIKTPENNEATVVNKFFHKNKKIYKVELEDGRIVEACGDHLWKTINPNRLERVLTTEEILNSNYFSKGAGMYLPLCSPIEDAEADHVIHPYLLGFILGDGCITDNQIVISTADLELVDKIQDLLPDNHYIKHVDRYDYRITSSIEGSGSNIVLNELRRLDLQGKKSNSKFVPLEYKIDSLTNKLSLLQGLLDSDGCVDKGNTIDYGTVSKKLADDFQELIFSLGGTCSVRTKVPTYKYKGEKKEGQLYYELSPKKLPFNIKKQLFSLKRKLVRIKPGQYDNCKKIKIKSIIFDRLEDCYCIAIDSPEKLYLTDNYIVTHNTFMALALASKLEQKALVVVHTLALMHQWAREVEKVFGFKPGLIGGGHDNSTPPIVIGNVASLYKRMDKLGKSFGTLIMDECHHVPAQSFSKIADKCYARYKIGLSGTLERKDGLHVILPDYFGFKIHKPEKENTVDPVIHAYDTKIHFPYGDLWAHRVTALQQDPAYTAWVLNRLRYYEQLGHKVLLVSDRVDFLKNIAQQSGAALIIGETDDRDSQFRALEDGSTNSICGAISIFKEGISHDPLSCVILGTPINNLPMLEQVIGRVQRLYPGKLQPVVVDPILRGHTTEKQFINRTGFYMREGFDIQYL